MDRFADRPFKTRRMRDVENPEMFISFVRICLERFSRVPEKY